MSNLATRRQLYYIEFQTWLPDLILGTNPFIIFCGWPVRAEVNVMLEITQ